MRAEVPSCSPALMTPCTPVSWMHRSTSCRHWMLPLANTGMATAFLPGERSLTLHPTWPMLSQGVKGTSPPNTILAGCVTSHPPDCCPQPPPGWSWVSGVLSIPRCAADFMHSPPLPPPATMKPKGLIAPSPTLCVHSPHSLDVFPGRCSC
jgi:hypothetical protein